MAAQMRLLNTTERELCGTKPPSGKSSVGIDELRYQALLAATGIIPDADFRKRVERIGKHLQLLRDTRELSKLEGKEFTERMDKIVRGIREGYGRCLPWMDDVDVVENIEADFSDILFEELISSMSKIPFLISNKQSIPSPAYVHQLAKQLNFLDKMDASQAGMALEHSPETNVLRLVKDEMKKKEFRRIPQ
jgi:hypothetical protein